MVGLVVGVQSVAIVDAGVMGSRIVAGSVAEPARRRIDDVLVASVFADGLVAGGYFVDRCIADRDLLLVGARSSCTGSSCTGSSRTALRARLLRARALPRTAVLRARALPNGFFVHGRCRVGQFRAACGSSPSGAGCRCRRRNVRSRLKSLRRDHVVALRRQELFPGPDLFARQRSAGATKGVTGGVITVDRAHCSLPCSEECVCTAGPVCAPPPVGPGADSAYTRFPTSVPLAFCISIACCRIPAAAT